MRYTIQEMVETVGWSEGIGTAPAELAKFAKEMAEKGEVATFGKLMHSTTPSSFTWCIVSVNKDGNMIIAKRHVESNDS